SFNDNAMPTSKQPASNRSNQAIGSPHVAVGDRAHDNAARDNDAAEPTFRLIPTGGLRRRSARSTGVRRLCIPGTAHVSSGADRRQLPQILSSDAGPK